MIAAAKNCMQNLVSNELHIIHLNATQGDPIVFFGPRTEHES